MFWERECPGDGIDFVEPWNDAMMPQFVFPKSFRDDAKFNKLKVWYDK